MAKEPEEPVERGEDGPGVAREPIEKLPWLTAIDEDEPQPKGGEGRSLLWVLPFLLLIIAAGGALLWMLPKYQSRQPETGNSAATVADPELAQSSAGNSASTGAGSAPTHSDDRAKQDSRPLVVARPAPVKAPALARRVPGLDRDASAVDAKPRDAAALRPRAKPLPVGGGAASPKDGSLVQLGAFDSRRTAELAWREVSGNDRLASLSPTIEPARVHGRIYYRLRVMLPKSGSCAALRLRDTRCIAVKP